MKITKGRHLSILFAIMNHDGVVTSDDLADFSLSSARTVKSDIVELNEDLMKENIAQIISTRSKGYYLESLDTNKFAQFKEMVMKEYGFYKNEDLEKISRRIMIAQNLLCNEYTLVDDLADQLFLTKSAIKNDLAWVTAFFASYDIELVSVSGKGLTPKGSEENLRSLMVEVFCSQYHEISMQYDVKEFETMFYEDHQYYADLRHALLKILRESQMSVLDVNTKKMATHLCLMQNRLKKGHKVLIDKKTAAHIKTLYEYKIAQQVFDTEYIVNYNEEEIIQFAKMLMCYRDIDLTDKNDWNTIPVDHISQTSNYLDRLLAGMKNELGGKLLELELFEVFRSSFESLLMPIYLRSHYDSNKKMRLVTYIDELADTDKSPLALQMSRIMLSISQEILDDKIDGSVFTPVSMLIDFLLKRINYQYTKRRLAVISQGGRAIAHARADALRKSYGAYIDFIHIYNQYEMRRINFNDYDCGLVETSNTYNYYSMSFVTYTGCHLEDESMNLFNQVFLKGFSKSIVEHMVTISSVYPKFDCDDYVTFMKLMCYKHAIDGKQEEMFEDLYSSDQNLSYFNKTSQVAMIFCQYKYTQKEFIEIYQPSTKMLWEKPHEIKYLIVISLSNDMKVSDLKTANKILFYLYYRVKYIQMAFDCIEDAYDACFIESVKNKFLSN